jgi:hypothetical protein
MSRSLIDELQLDAANPQLTVSALLRKALLVAAKLEVNVVPDWINNELSGYEDDSNLPSYRLLHGRVMAKNPMRGWIPVRLPTNEFQAKVSEQKLLNPVSQLEKLVEVEGGTLQCSYPPEAEAVLCEMFKLKVEYACILERAHIVGIFEEVRTRILRWAIELDKTGIRGEGLSFSAQEKQKARSMVFNAGNGHITIGVAADIANHPIVASGSGARVNVRSDDASTNLIGSDAARLAQELSTLREQLLGKASSPEHYAAIGAIASAEMATTEGKTGEASKAPAALGTGAKWALGVAKDIGVPLAIQAIKAHLGLPPA